MREYRVPTLTFLSQTAPPSTEQSREVFDALCRSTSDIHLDRFGWAYAAYDRVFSLVPWNSGGGPGGNPLLFVDESYDEPTQTTLYSGLLMNSGAAFILAGWYLGSLVTLRKQVAPVWPVDTRPPRLHFREMFNEHARQKTTWRSLGVQAITDLISVVADALGENEHVHPFVVRVPDAEIEKALTAAFPGGADERAIEDLVGQIVAQALTSAVVDNTSRGLKIDLVIDYDATKIHVGRIREADHALDVGGKRQSTQRFIEAICSTPTDPRLLVNAAARNTSHFPADLTWARFTAHGCPFRPLIEAIGLQFADLYINVWRHLQYGAYPQLGVSRRILARAKQTDYFWAPPADGDGRRPPFASGFPVE